MRVDPPSEKHGLIAEAYDSAQAPSEEYDGAGHLLTIGTFLAIP